MKVCVGPVEPVSARAWIGWAQEMLGVVRRAPIAAPTLPDAVLGDVGAYLDMWAGTAHDGGDAFRWHDDLHPDELEYLANSLHNLDLQLADQSRRCSGRSEPTEGRSFHVLLVDALLFALAEAGPSRAAFAEQLRSSWPVRHPDRTSTPSSAEPHPAAGPGQPHVPRPTAAWAPVRLRIRCARSWA